MIDHVGNLWASIDQYLTSKTNAAVSLTTSVALTASAKVSHGTDWVFIFQCIGSFYICLQIVHILYKFYKWLRSFEDAQQDTTKTQ
jgi:hypothetical protein